MSRDPDTLLLFAGLIRASIWFGGVYVGYKIRQVLPVAGNLLIFGFLLAGIGSTIFAFSNAHYAVDSTILDVASYSATITAAALVTGIGLVSLFTTRLRKRLERLRKEDNHGR